MAHLGKDEDIVPEEELGEERDPDIPLEALEQSVSTKFGRIELEGSPALEIISAIVRKLNEVEILLDQEHQRHHDTPGIYEQLNNPYEDTQAVAITMYNLWRESKGVLVEIRSDIRAIKKDVKTLERHERVKEQRR